MFNLEDVIGSILQEAEPAPVPAASTASTSKTASWWKDVVKAYNTANTGFILPTNTNKPVGEIATSIFSVLNSSASISPDAYKIAYLPIVDLCKRLFTFLNKSGLSKLTLEQFVAAVQAEYEKLNSEITNTIKNG